MMDREQILETAISLITGDRHNSYGEASAHFAEVAKVWSVVLGQEVSSADVLLCMVSLKLVRLSGDPTHLDSWIDLAGYSGLGGELSKKDEE